MAPGGEEGEELAAEGLARDGVEEEVDRVVEVLEGEEEAAQRVGVPGGVDEARLLDRLQHDDGHGGEAEGGRHRDQHDRQLAVEVGRLLRLAAACQRWVIENRDR